MEQSIAEFFVNLAYAITEDKEKYRLSGSNTGSEFTTDLHLSHLSNNKQSNNIIEGMTVDIGEDRDWTKIWFNGVHDIKICGEE